MWLLTPSQLIWKKTFVPLHLAEVGYHHRNQQLLQTQVSLPHPFPKPTCLHVANKSPCLHPKAFQKRYFQMQHAMTQQHTCNITLTKSTFFLCQCRTSEVTINTLPTWRSFQRFPLCLILLFPGYMEDNDSQPSYGYPPHKLSSS